MQSQTEVNLMQNKFDLSQVDDAWEHLTRFEKQSANVDYYLLRNRWGIRMKDLKGTILLSRGDLEGAEALARQCLDTSIRAGYKKFEVRRNDFLDGY